MFFYTHTVKIPLKILKLTRTKTYGLFVMHNRREMRCTEQSKRNIRSAELKTLTAVELYWATKVVETRVPKTTFSVQYVYSEQFYQTRFYRNKKHSFSKLCIELTNLYWVTFLQNFLVTFSNNLVEISLQLFDFVWFYLISFNYIYKNKTIKGY